MTTTAYKDNSIFANTLQNAMCDLLFTKLVAKFPPAVDDVDNDFIYKGILLTGKAANVLHEEAEQPINNIIFQTNKEDVYKFLLANIKTIFNCKIVKFQERILFYPRDFYFEVWYTPGTLKPILRENIYVQEFGFIPEETLSL